MNKTQRVTLLMNAFADDPIPPSPPPPTKRQAAWLIDACGLINPMLESVQVTPTYLAATDGHRIHLLGTPPREQPRENSVTTYSFATSLPNDLLPTRIGNRAPIENIFLERSPTYLWKLPDAAKLRGILKGAAGKLRDDFRARQVELKDVEKRLSALTWSTIRHNAKLRQEAAELEVQKFRLELPSYVKLTLANETLTVEFPQLPEYEFSCLPCESVTTDTPDSLVIHFQFRYLSSAIEIMPAKLPLSIGATSPTDPVFFSFLGTHAVVMPFREP